MISGSTFFAETFIYDVNTLSWVRQTQPLVNADTLSVTLPATAATAARQDTGNTSLASLDGKAPALVGGRVPVDGSGVTQPVSGTFWQVTQPVSGTFWQATQPVSGTFWQATQPVSGTFWQATQPVSGTFWQTTQPVSAATLPLPSGAATETTLVSLNDKVTAVNTGAVVLTTGTASIGKLASNSGVDIGDVDVLTLPAITGTVTANAGTGTMAVSGPLTDTQLRATAVPISGSVTATGGGYLTDTQLRATAVPVSGTVTTAEQTSGGKTITFVSVAQGAAGTTALAAASVGNKHKLVGCVLTMSAAGTLKLTDGVADLTGAMDIAANGGFVLPTGLLPYTETAATNRALNLVTTTGAAKGAVAILTEA